jgi:hypothetical protein
VDIISTRPGADPKSFEAGRNANSGFGEIEPNWSDRNTFAYVKTHRFTVLVVSRELFPKTFPKRDY